MEQPQSPSLISDIEYEQLLTPPPPYPDNTRTCPDAPRKPPRCADDMAVMPSRAPAGMPSLHPYLPRPAKRRLNFEEEEEEHITVSSDATLMDDSVVLYVETELMCGMLPGSADERTPARDAYAATCNPKCAHIIISGYRFETCGVTSFSIQHPFGKAMYQVTAVRPLDKQQADAPALTQPRLSLYAALEALQHVENNLSVFFESGVSHLKLFCTSSYCYETLSRDYHSVGWMRSNRRHPLHLDLIRPLGMIIRRLCLVFKFEMELVEDESHDALKNEVSLLRIHATKVARNCAEE